MDLDGNPMVWEIHEVTPIPPSSSRDRIADTEMNELLTYPLRSTGLAARG